MANCLLNTSQFKGQFIRPWITAGCAWIERRFSEIIVLKPSAECQCFSLEEVSVDVFL